MTRSVGGRQEPELGPRAFHEPTSIFSSMSCLAWSICWGEPRIINSLKLGSPLGGSCREISTKAPVCWFMAFTFSPPAGDTGSEGRVGGKSSVGMKGRERPTHLGR